MNVFLRKYTRLPIRFGLGMEPSFSHWFRVGREISRILAATSLVRSGLSVEVGIKDLVSSLTACRIKVSRTSFRSFVSNREMLFMARA